MIKVTLKLIILLLFGSSSAFAVGMIVDFESGFESSSRDVLLARGIIEYAVSEIFEPQLGGQVTLHIKAELLDLPVNVSGSGGPVALTHKYLNPLSPIPGLLPGRWYALALASECSGMDLKATSGLHSGYHMHIAFNRIMLNNEEFWLYHDRDCPVNKKDFLSAVIHEIGHALCFGAVVDINGNYPDDMPSTFEINLSGNFDPEPEMYTFEELGHSGREIVLLDGDVWWHGAAMFVVGQRKRQTFPPDDAFNASYYYAKMMAPITTWSVSHWHTSHSRPEQVMEPALSDDLGSFMAREIGLLGPALQDMGWPDMALMAASPTTLLFAPTSMNKSLSAPQTVVVSNNRNGVTSITQVEILGDHAGSFSILSGGSPTTLPYLGTLYISVGFSPGSVGYKEATLRISYNDGITKHVDVALEGFGIMTDSDDDGISDFDETRDLYGLSNPFNWQVTDSTGENRETTGDGVDDGYNDFDGDGMSNREEFIFGYNPIDPDNYGVRTAYDTDGDGILDEDEAADLSGPFDPYNGDTSGDYFSDVPDGIPDGQNDYDGDGFDNAFEYRWGTNPLEPDFDIKIPASSSLGVGVSLISLLFFGVLLLKKRSWRS